MIPLGVPIWAVLGAILAISAAGNAWQYRAAQRAAEALGAAQAAASQAQLSARQCSDGVAALRKAAEAQAGRARQAAAMAQARARAAEARSQAVLATLPAVQGNACASAAALNLERLKARKGAP